MSFWILGVFGISECEAFTHQEELRIALPHQLVAGFGIVLASEVATDASDKSNGIAQG